MVVEISSKKKLYSSWFFQARLCGTHRMVIFVIAQLSCSLWSCISLKQGELGPKLLLIT